MQVQELVGIVPWTFIAQICNLFLQMYLIKRFLFKPINEMLEKRRAAADAEAMKAGAEKAIATEREKQMDELHVQIMDLAVEAAGRIMAEKSSPETDKALYDAFIKEAGDVDNAKNE